MESDNELVGAEVDAETHPNYRLSFESRGRPGQVIAGEERLLAIQQHLVAPRVARRRDGNQI